MVARILCFVGLYLGFGALFALQSRDKGNNLYEVFRNKILYAERAVGSRRILLAGGSNVMWGFRSHKIEEMTGIPTFNMGLMHEGFDPEAMRTLLRHVVRSGDIVVYSSLSFWNSRSASPELGQRLLKAAGLSNEGWDAVQYYWAPLPSENPLIHSLPALIERYVIAKPAVPSNTNEKGDSNYCDRPEDLQRAVFAEPPDGQALLTTLHNFEDALKAKGARMVLSIPYVMIRPDDRDSWLQKYQPLWDTLRNEFSVSWEALDTVLRDDRGQFCDTPFHLNASVAERRSQTLSHYLKDRSIFAQK